MLERHSKGQNGAKAPSSRKCALEVLDLII